MKTVVLSILALAGAAGSANAALSSITAQVWDGSAWSNNANVLAGSAVRVRYVLNLADAAGTGAIALNGANFQPVFSGWSGADGINLGATTGNYTVAPDADFTNDVEVAGHQPFGRQAAFAFPNITAANTLKAHISGTTLRIAQTPVTNAPGSGTGFNNLNGSGGVPVGQNIAAGSGRPAGSPNVVLGTTDVAAYGVLVTTSASSALGRVIGVGSTAFSTGATIRWFAGTSELSGSVTSTASEISFIPATITIVPTPASLALLGLGGLVAARRRR